jgi:hypothetical protein
MDTKRIIYTAAEGNLAVIVPAPGCTQEQALKAVPAGASYEIVDVADVPSDRTFRNAWLHDTTASPQKVGVDMVKAQGIAHDKRRAKRAAEFAPLDVQATIPAKANAAEAARQAIRDKDATIQLAVDSATTPEALKALIETEGL